MGGISIFEGERCVGGERKETCQIVDGNFQFGVGENVCEFVDGSFRGKFSDFLCASIDRFS